ncbi:ABC transporter substrate-binding protein [Halomonas sp. Bachu 37]|uniref:ABC transporter substrate-binding protein n=1 Tax=Halomonas kashgarensis TaxID=3084920 RepID=UPI003216CE25
MSPFAQGRSRLTAVLLLLGLLSASVQAAAKEQLVLAIGGEPEQGYDPLLGWGQYGHPLFQSTLLSRDASLASRPDLATRWELSEDRLTWNITLRDDARFADGTALTARDAAYTFRHAAQAGGRADLSVLEQAEAVSPYHLRLTLSEPRITFAEHFHTLGIVPHGDRDNGYNEEYGRSPLGSGPYRMVEWQEGEQLIVERNPYFHGKQPAFQRLVFRFMGEDTTLAAANAGQVDVAVAPPALAGRTPDGMHRVAMQSVDNRGILFPMQPALGETTGDGLAIGNDVTADPAIRQAINLGLDRDVLVEVALHGFGRPAHGPADGLPWDNPEARLSPTGADAAIAVLEAAGWKPDESGIRHRDGLPARFRLNYPSHDTTRQLLAEVSAEMLRPVGIEMIPTGRHWDDIQRKALHSDAILFGWGSHSPQEIYYLYHSAHAGQGFYNAGLYANSAVDTHLETAQAAASLEASYPSWQAAQWDGETGYGERGDAAWAWLVNLEHLYFVDSCLDIGELPTAPHGHGWPVTASLLDWRWTCD